MTEGLVKKKRIRAGHRGVVSKRILEVEGLLKDKAAMAGESGKVKLSQLQLTLKEKLATLKQLDGEIIDMLDAEDEVKTEIESSDEFLQKVYEALVKMEHCETSARATGLPTSAGGGGLEGGSAPTLPGHSKAKLPKLVLQPFDGDITKWKTFWDSYTSAIDSDPSLSKVDKFTYLQSLLEKTAKEAVGGLALTSENYDQAVSILEKRFGNKQMIIHRHMEILLGIEGVNTNGNLLALRKLYDKVESNVRSLEALGVKPESYGSLLSSVLIKKLPNEFRLTVTRKVTDDKWELETIMKVMSDELEARERSATPLIKDGRRRVDPPTASAFVVSNRQVSSNCCYCGGQHSSETCNAVRTARDRKQILRTTGRCYVCLKTGHRSRNCRSRYKCMQCGMRHHRSICEVPQGGDVRVVEGPVNSRGKGQSEPSVPNSSHLNPSAPSFGHTSATCCCGNSPNSVLLQTAQAILFNPNYPEKNLKVSILLDSGSQCSYITEAASRLLDLRNKGNKVMTIVTFGSKSSNTVTCKKVDIGVQKNGQSQVLSVYTVPMICEPLKQPPIEAIVQETECFQGLVLASGLSREVVQPDVLIGMDHYWTFVTGEYIHVPNGPVAMNTTLGWVLSGPTPHTFLEEESTSLVTHVLRASMSVEESNRRLDRQLHRFWDLESIGVVDEERTIYEQFIDLVQLREGRYEVLLPWKDPSEVIPDNYPLCLKRLQSLLRRLTQNPRLLQQYDEVIQGQIQKGILEPVGLERGITGQTPEQGLIHYLPHHAVVKQENQTTKVRVVYDASARSGHGPSLNDCLHVGPKFSQKIMEILLRFRVHNVVVAADIEKAFLMIAVHSRDRDALRFLWVKDIAKDPPDICAYRFARVVFGVACSPFLLNATIRQHIERYASTHPSLVSQLKRSIYVDDVVMGTATQEEAYEQYSETCRILKEGGFNLRKFCTNHKGLRSIICKEEGDSEINKPSETYTAVTLGKSQSTQSGERKVLGIRWKTDTDELMFSTKEIAETASQIIPSKRQVVSVVGRFYDPLGILAPVLVPFKIYFQRLCKAEIPWDQPLQGELLQEWQVLVRGLTGKEIISVPRHYQDDSFHQENRATAQLYGFCDASMKAYAAVVYIVMGNRERRNVPRLVCAKTRVAPLKKLSIPRLELLSGLLLSKLIHTVTTSLKEELQLLPSKCFTDSKVAYHWIKGSSKGWKPFVQNRINQIKKLVAAEQWYHCPGLENPADLPSRGISLTELSESHLWFNGPPWLGYDDQLTDLTIEPHEVPRECLQEHKPTECISALAVSGVRKPLIQLDRYSDLNRMLRISAYVRLFLQRVRGRKTKLVDLITQEEQWWIREVQVSLRNDHDKFDTLRRQLNLFQDSDGIWRCKGRIHKANLPYSTKFPIILPNYHTFTKMVIQQRAHERVFHNGVKETLTELRSQYWVTKGRSVIRNVIHECVICRRLEAVAYRTPPAPPLPEFRIMEAPAFTFVGIDFAGPLYIKQHRAEVGSTKVWLCLYTCCVTRSVHLDLVLDLTTEAFLRCFKRFVARRGVPTRIISDNGSTFKAAAKILSDSSINNVSAHIATMRIKWTFNVERAPWWGGVFERMIKMTKRCLRKVVGRASLGYEELLTVVTEIEMIINCRPLSFLSQDDLEEPLTPSHLMTGRRLLSLTGRTVDSEEDCEDPQFEFGHGAFSKRMRLIDRTMQHFWKRWRTEYLLELRTHHGLKARQRGQQLIREGDVVVIYDEQERRRFWRIGLVVETTRERWRDSRSSSESMPKGKQVQVNEKIHSASIPIRGW